MDLINWARREAAMWRTSWKGYDDSATNMEALADALEHAEAELTSLRPSMAEIERDEAMARAERAEAELDALREVLKKAEEALDQAECVIDADDSVEVFNYVQTVRKLARAALNYPRGRSR